MTEQCKHQYRKLKVLYHAGDPYSAIFFCSKCLMIEKVSFRG
jgi:hypothetical protein